jgi:hypothetical protein
MVHSFYQNIAQAKGVSQVATKKAAFHNEDSHFRRLLQTELFSLRRINRTYACARTALDASISSDNVLAVALGNAIYRTLRCACTARNTFIRNNICHFVTPPPK